MSLAILIAPPIRFVNKTEILEYADKDNLIPSLGGTATKDEPRSVYVCVKYRAHFIRNIIPRLEFETGLHFAYGDATAASVSP